MLCAAAVFAVLETLSGWRLVAAHGLPDPDNYMRLVRIRDELNLHGLTHIVAADNGGLGTVVYWSHPIDAAVLAIWLPLRLVLDSQAALLAAGCIFAPLIAAGLAAALVWAPAPLVRERWVLTTPLLALAASPALMAYGIFGNVHHHLPLVLAAVLAAGFAGRALSGSGRAAFRCGLCAAGAIWLSPEGLPYVLMAMGVLAVAWCQQPRAMAPALRLCGVGFLAGTAAALLLDPPQGGWLSPEIDCLSVVFLVLAALVFAAASALAALPEEATTVPQRAAACLLAGVAAVGCWLWLYPAFVRGLGGLVPQADATAFFGAIVEMQPTYSRPSALVALVAPALAVLLAAGLAVRRRSLPWAYAALCGAVVLALAAMAFRFVGYAEALTALMLPVGVALAAGLPSPARRLAAQLAALATVVAVHVGAVLCASAAPADIMASCRVADIAPALRQVPDAVVLTQIGDTPEILWRTPVRTVGSFYHRSIDAFIRARAAWRSLPSAHVPTAVRTTGATHILACDLTHRSALVDGLPADTLEDRLARHDVPAWLHEVGRAGGFRLYRIDGAPG
jgi:hypothetical protein